MTEEQNKTENELVVLEEINYPVSTTEIENFNAKWKEVPTLTPENGIKDTAFIEVKKAHIEAVRFRTGIEKQRKHLKAPSIEYGKSVDKIARELQESINPKELELFEQRNKVEQFEKVQEQKRIDAERERVELIVNNITKLKMIPLESMGKNSNDLTAIYGGIIIPSEEEYQERIEEAILTYKDTMQKLEVAIDTAQKAEQAEAIQAETEAKRAKEDEERQAKYRAEREAFEAEKREFQEQKEAQERLMREQQEEINRQERLREIEEQEQGEAQERLMREQQEEINRQERLREIEEQEQGEAQERLMREQQGKKLFDDKYKETITEMKTFISEENLLDGIIKGNIPNVKWEINNA